MKMFSQIQNQRAWQRCCYALCCALSLTACGGTENTEPAPDAIITVGTRSLTRSQLAKEMPGGISPKDSAVFARSYIRQWAYAQLIADVASKEIDLTDIDRQVQDYRNQLIMHEYTRRMYEGKGLHTVPEDSLRAFYEANKDTYRLKRPMVKGVFLKVASDSPALPTLRKLYKSHTAADIDKLDKALLNGAVHYDYFRDKWIDWDQIESRIPYRFGPGNDAYLRSHPSLDFEADGFTYLLDISDALQSGQHMPFEAARPLIEDRFSIEARNAYRERLKKELYDNAVADGYIKTY